MADQKLNFNINLGEIRYLEVPDITDYKLVFITKKFKTMDPIWRTDQFYWIYSIVYLDSEITVKFFGIQ